MKFLYLKDIDVFGPFEVEQIIREDCFSQDLLVCPEDKAEQAAAWKPASCYPEFKISLKKEIFPAQEAKPIVKPVDNKEQMVSVSVGNDKTFPELPALEDTETDPSEMDLKDLEKSFKGIMKELSSPEKESLSEEDEDIEDHTFHIAHKEDNLLEDLPASALLEPEEKKDVTGNNSRLAPKESNSYNQENIDNVQEIDNIQGDKDLLDISNNKILSSSDGRVKRKSNDLIFILSFLVLMIVAIALCMAFWNMKNENKAANEKATINQNEEKNDSASDEEKTLVTKILDQNKEVQQDSSNEVSPKMDIEEQVIDIVKNTNLAKKGESIGAYLQNTYGAEYQYSWSAKPFTDNVYIVEFFASQVRSEPYVYLFRVDMDQKKITGALNNITLDLLS